MRGGETLVGIGGSEALILHYVLMKKSCAAAPVSDDEDRILNGPGRVDLPLEEAVLQRGEG